MVFILIFYRYKCYGAIWMRGRSISCQCGQIYLELSWRSTSVCALLGATLATYDQLYTAWEAGLQKCTYVLFYSLLSFMIHSVSLLLGCLCLNWRMFQVFSKNKSFLNYTCEMYFFPQVWFEAGLCIHLP